MSAEAIHFQQLSGRQFSTNEVGQMEASKDADLVLPRALSAFVYRVLDTPPPTPDELRREYFLLECD